LKSERGQKLEKQKRKEFINRLHVNPGKLKLQSALHEKYNNNIKIISYKGMSGIDYSITRKGKSHNELKSY
jgi:hypothetical protein